MSVPPSAAMLPEPIADESRSSSRDQAARLRALVASIPAPARAETVRPAETTQPRPRGRSARVITIASGKGGVGKTSIAVNLSIALHRAGFRTTLVDADFGTANVDVMCGLSPSRRIDPGRGDGASSCTLANLATPTPYGFHLVPGSVGTAGSVELSTEQRRRFVSGLCELDQTSDVVVIDTAAGIGPNTRCFMHAADLPLVLLTPDPASIADAYALLKCLAAEGLSQDSGVSFILNQVGSSAEAAAVASRLGAVSRRFLRIDPTMIGSIAWDAQALIASRSRHPLMAGSCKSQACKDLDLIACAIMERLLLSKPSALVKSATRPWWAVWRDDHPRLNAGTVL